MEMGRDQPAAGTNISLALSFGPGVGACSRLSAPTNTRLAPDTSQYKYKCFPTIEL